MVGTQDARDFTALGDPMNITAHLASQAAAGEVLVTEPVVERTSLQQTTLERRHLSLKGYPIDALVLPPAPVSGPTG
jgi:adenylate cyclase